MLKLGKNFDKSTKKLTLCDPSTLQLVLKIDTIFVKIINKYNSYLVEVGLVLSVLIWNNPDYLSPVKLQKLIIIIID